MTKETKDWVRVPREPKEAWLRAFIMCPADEVLLAWEATLKVINKLAAAPQETKAEGAVEFTDENLHVIAKKHARNAVSSEGFGKDDPVVMQDRLRAEEVIFYAMKDLLRFTSPSGSLQNTPAEPVPGRGATPRTDDAQYHPFDNMGNDHPDWVVDADFARQLERELEEYKVAFAAATERADLATTTLAASELAETAKLIATNIRALKSLPPHGEREEYDCPIHGNLGGDTECPKC